MKRKRFFCDSADWMPDRWQGKGDSGSGKFNRGCSGNYGRNFSPLSFRHTAGRLLFVRG